MINKLAIFCGSKKGNNSLYEEQATELAQILAAKSVELIYGGGKNGLMGVVADTVLAKGGIVRGVIPKVLVDWEHQHDTISELFVVDDMHLRKRKLYELCDGAIILPGGFGTLDELFEILTWNQLSIHDKKIFILNSGGFYDHLIAHMQLLSGEGFLYGTLEEKLTLLNEPAELLPYLD
ncbi:MAG: TIGR00730 family Rossman fold protein [Bacteroidota bacterium]|nr:TIGR00730 family Rossman fold protein [Bacteroidota bacterium]